MSLYWGSTEDLGLAHAFWHSTPWRSVCGIVTGSVNSGYPYAKESPDKSPCTPCVEYLKQLGIKHEDHPGIRTDYRPDLRRAVHP